MTALLPIIHAQSKTLASLEAEVVTLRRQLEHAREDAARTAAALSLARDNLTGERSPQNPDRALFWIDRALVEMGEEPNEPDFNEAYRDLRFYLRGSAHEAEIEARRAASE